MKYEKPVNQCCKHLFSMSSLASILYKEGKQRQAIILKCSIDSLVRCPVLFLTCMVFLFFFLLSSPSFSVAKQDTTLTWEKRVYSKATGIALLLSLFSHRREKMGTSCCVIEKEGETINRRLTQSKSLAVCPYGFLPIALLI